MWPRIKLKVAIYSSNRVRVSLVKASVMRDLEWQVVTLLSEVDLNHAISPPFLIQWQHVNKFVASMFNIVHTAFSFVVA